MADNTIGGFDPSKLTGANKETWDMQQALSNQQAQTTMMNMYIQYKEQEQKEKFDMLSNTMKKGEDTQNNINANLK